MRYTGKAVFIGFLGFGGVVEDSEANSVAKIWNEQCLDGIRLDFPAPTIHARNLFHLSAAMYDAWAAYDPAAVGVFHNESATAGDVAAARDEAVSFAAYHVLHARYSPAVDGQTTVDALNAQMDALGYDETYVITPPTENSPAAVGIRCANAVLARGSTDSSNESGLYVDTTGYAPVNDALDFAEFPGTVDYDFGMGFPPVYTETVSDINRWQPLYFDDPKTQNGQVSTNTQIFIGPHWGSVRPFALTGSVTDGLWEDYDPGPPPYLGGVGDAQMKTNVNEVIEFSSKLDPNSGVMIDISPKSIGNNTLGQNDGSGHALNPATSAPYVETIVKEGDFGRVVAEFWADGPNSETPPGHWNTLANEAFEHVSFERRLGGVGPILPELEWDVKIYLALNGALHDTAIAAWGVKNHYDYVRPITLIRYMGETGFNVFQTDNIRGQSTDNGLVSYHPDGLKLESGVVEVVTASSLLPGGNHHGLGLNEDEVVIKAWDNRNIPVGGVGGVEWYPAGLWRPYQMSTFVTPAFAGYVSGHSAFSRAAAEVLTSFTGSEYFPGGLGTHTYPMGELDFEFGPTEDIELQWATYYDAADQAGLSRLYGGIHVAADDGPGRIMGSKIGKDAAAKALLYFDGSILDGFRSTSEFQGSFFSLTWPSIPGYLYQVQSSPTLNNVDFVNETGLTSSVEGIQSFIETTTHDTRFYRIKRQAP